MVHKIWFGYSQGPLWPVIHEFTVYLATSSFLLMSGKNACKKSQSRADENDIYITHLWFLDREATTPNLKPKCHLWTWLGFREVCWLYSCSSVDTFSLLMILEPFLYKRISGLDWQTKKQILMALHLNSMSKHMQHLFFMLLYANVSTV